MIHYQELVLFSEGSDEETMAGRAKSESRRHWLEAGETCLDVWGLSSCFTVNLRILPLSNRWKFLTANCSPFKKSPSSISGKMSNMSPQCLLKKRRCPAEWGCLKVTHLQNSFQGLHIHVTLLYIKTFYSKRWVWWLKLLKLLLRVLLSFLSLVVQLWHWVCRYCNVFIGLNY